MISSVARKATIREDRSIREAMQIIGQQQAVAGRLALQQQKQQQAAIAAKNEETSKQFKTLREIESPYSPYNEDFDKRHADVENALIDPNVAFNQKELMLTDLTQYSKLTGVVKGAIIKNANDRVGTEEQRKFRNADEIARAQVNYIQPTGEPINPTDFDEQKLNDAVDNTLSTYNVSNTVEGFMDQQKTVVATETSSKNLASGFSRNDIINKAAKFLVLNESGTGYKTDDATGKPIASITGENLAAFENFSKGNKLSIDEYLTRPGNENKTRLDGMKDVLEQNGWLTARETVETKLQPTPKPSTAGEGRAQRIASVNDRIKFFDESIEKGGDRILSQLKTSRGVVTADQEGNKTGVTPIPGGLRFTIIQDPSKVLDVPRTYINAEGVEQEFASLTSKEQKFITTQIDVMDSDPLTGLIELNAKFDQTVGSKFEIDPIDFVEQYQKIHAGDVADPFGGAFSGEDPFGGAFSGQ